MTFTQEELECVISVVEMVLDGSGCTFADWGEVNPTGLTVLESVDHKLRVLNGEVLAAVVGLNKVKQVTMVSLLLQLDSPPAGEGPRWDDEEL